MRTYSIIRNGSKIIYRQVNNITNINTQITTICIPSTIPVILDPFLLWKETNDRTAIKSMSILDMNQTSWFTLTSTKYPLAKMLELSADILHEMK